MSIQPTQSTTEITQPKMSIRARAGAAGKALIVYLGSGSIVLAIVAYLIFNSMGC